MASTRPTAVRRLILRILARSANVVLLLILVLAALAAGGYWWLDQNVLSTLPKDLSVFRNYRPPTSCRVFASDGREVDQFYLERRIWMPLREMSPVVPLAFMSAEDRRFLTHPGIDAVGIARAVLQNLRAGTVIQGGSTLTQQLVKNLLVGRERSYHRKLSEAVLAYRLERELTKEEILELYLNYVYLGSGNHGVEAAARDYFGISARFLDAGDAALLAGLVSAPSRYSPRSHPEVAAERRALVLRSMVRDGHLQPKEVHAFLDDPVIEPREVRPEERLATAYVTQVRREIRRLAGAELPFQEGLQLHTPLDLKVQEVAQGAVRQALVDLAQRQGRAAPLAHVDPGDRAAFLQRATGLERHPNGELLPPETGDCFEALVGPKGNLGTLSAGGWSFLLKDEDRKAKVRPPEGKKVSPTLGERVVEGDVLRVCLEEGDRVRLDDRPWGEGAAVVLENKTGRVVALVGGYDVGLEGFVRATQALRQPGSSFKPFVYAAKLLKGGSQLDRVVDAPLSLAAGGGKIWSPRNFNDTFAGPLPMRNALAQSLNTVAVRLALDVGSDEIVKVARALGVRSPLRSDLTIALGSAEVTPLDLAVAYAGIARMGVTVEPVFIERVHDSGGERVGAAGQSLVIDAQSVVRLPGGDGTAALPPAVAYQVADMLREVVRTGTARRAHQPQLDRAGKTGTTNGYVDAWFVGFTPRYTVAVWIGTDGQLSLGDKETGGKAALPAWIRIVEALGETPGERLPVPDDVVMLPFGGAWVGVTRDYVPSTALPTVAVGDEPLPVFGAR